MCKSPLLSLTALISLTGLGFSQQKPAQPAPAAPAPAAAPSPAKPDPLQAQKDEVAKTTLERDKLAAELALVQTKLEKELSDTKTRVQKMQSELGELKAQQEMEDYKQKLASDKELAPLRKQLERAMLESNLAKALVETESAEIHRIENAVRKETSKLSVAMELEQKQAEERTYAEAEPIYLKEPLQGRRLILSDRRIPLNGLITNATADTITDRINYFNNRNRELPIFIVIDDSPGGSVMAGYKILKAMQGSEAPVYVIVKSFAASMAACITTLAKHSFAYPNAVILHHQIAAVSAGNLTQQQEWVKEMEEWWKRLADPVAQKMGITREEFIKQMYAHTSSGDWNEFADRAQKLKWVDTIVDEIQETSTVRLGDSATGMSPRMPSPGHEASTLTESKDEKGRPYLTLPRLNPMDCYWIYNPDGYFRQP
jgi:ATP-dependent Clp protease, protease subunit